MSDKKDALNNQQYGQTFIDGLLHEHYEQLSGKNHEQSIQQIMRQIRTIQKPVSVSFFFTDKITGWIDLLRRRAFIFACTAAALVCMIYLGKNISRPELIYPREGNLLIIRPGIKIHKDKREIPALGRIPVYANDEMYTDSGGAFAVLYDDGTEIGAGHLTRLSVKKNKEFYRNRQKYADKKDLLLHEGIIIIDLVHQKKDKPLTITASGIIINSSKGLFTIINRPGFLYIDVQDGNITVQNEDLIQNISAGNSVLFEDQKMYREKDIQICNSWAIIDRMLKNFSAVAHEGLAKKSNRSFGDICLRYPLRLENAWN
ncbi:MAG TPA: hypothetical protein DC049_10150 [Spirochaetia bacterium]|nr:hypothetical protein [Spirochaetia bacterium]